MLPETELAAIPELLPKAALFEGRLPRTVVPADWIDPEPDNTVTVLAGVVTGGGAGFDPPFDARVSNDGVYRK